MNQSFSILTVLVCLLMMACGTNKSGQSKYQCGRGLTSTEIGQISTSGFKGYSDEDLEILANLTTLVTQLNGDSLEYEVFFFEKASTRLVLGVFGVEKAEQIEKTACAIFERKDLKLPKEQWLLFHKYVNGNAESEFLIGISNK